MTFFFPSRLYSREEPVINFSWQTGTSLGRARCWSGGAGASGLEVRGRL